MRLLVWIFVIILLLFAMSFMLRVTYTEQHIEYVDVHQDTVAPAGDEICEMVDFYYGYQWIDWQSNPEAMQMSPLLYLANLEDRTGTFMVRYAFIDDSKYPFEEFKNKPLQESMVEFYTAEKVFELYPFQQITVVIPTVVLPNVSYWVYAVITAPQYKICVMNEEVIEFTRTEPRRTNLEKSVSLASYLFQMLKKSTTPS